MAMVEGMAGLRWAASAETRGGDVWPALGPLPCEGQRHCTKSLPRTCWHRRGWPWPRYVNVGRNGTSGPSSAMAADVGVWGLGRPSAAQSYHDVHELNGG